ncbi:hypothetical protein GQ53DRAFT_459785 [Thozetella sp. PMI_491]|nr:hypothetical protein GQ53DRAFT_459785 [Thozetella sp. PMI_491]
MNACCIEWGPPPVYCRQGAEARSSDRSSYTPSLAKPQLLRDFLASRQEQHHLPTMSAPASSKYGPPASFEVLCERWGTPPAELTTATVEYIAHGFLCEAKLRKRKYGSGRARRACTMAAKMLRGISGVLSVPRHADPEGLSGGGDAHSTTENGRSMDVEREPQLVQPIEGVEGSGVDNAEALGLRSEIRIGDRENSVVVSTARGSTPLVLPERPAQTASGLTLEQLELRSRWMVEVLVPKLETINRELEGYSIHPENSN